MEVSLKCMICKKEFVKDEKIKLSNKGIETIKKYSILKGDEQMKTCLSSSNLCDIAYVHSHCRRNYTNERAFNQMKRKIEQSESSTDCSGKMLRSVENFDWKQHCFLCGQVVPGGSGNSQKGKTSSVMTLKFQQTITDICKTRNDEWSTEVLGRLSMCIDLTAAEACYHRICHSAFLNGQSLPLLYDNEVKVNFPGRCPNNELSLVFEKLCNWLEDEENGLYTLYDLRKKMQEINENDDVYSIKHLKRKLLDRYGDNMFFATVSGKKNVFCLKDLACQLISDKWYQERKSNIEDESIRIVVSAAKLIKSQIRAMLPNNDYYPKTNDINDKEKAKEWIPNLLRVFMENIINSEVKQLSLCQAILQSARPRSLISPILFSIGVTLDHMFGSKKLIDILSRLGFSASYDEVNLFKQSVIQCETPDLPQVYPDSFTQWSGDNVDHNTMTLDGKGTFHGMGIISMSTSYNVIESGQFSEIAIPRLTRVKSNIIVNNQNIPILKYNLPNKSALSFLHFKPMSHLNYPVVYPATLNLELAWKIGMTCFDEEQGRPNWSGFMDYACKSNDEFTSISDIKMLPIIDLNPNDVSCIYSTLVFIEKQAHRLNIHTACITFDQPLWLKAVDIVQSSKLNVVCRLGGFHSIMSFLGSIGYIMSGSGLEDSLQCCYGPIAVNHMMSGRAVARALRGHFLVESAVFSLLLEHMLEMNFLNIDDINALKFFYKNIFNNNISIYEEKFPNCFEKINEAIRSCNNEIIANNNRTGKLWMQYLESLTILKSFIIGDRTSNWNLHLTSLKQMLNFFAAAGHTKYAKSARLYLQLMHDLPVTHPWLHEQLSLGGFHAIRRSNKYWAGLSADLIIEQVMMKSVKSKGGLTHGRGMSNAVRLLWVSSMHKCASITNGLMDLANMNNLSSDCHHKELGTSRVNRDINDIKKLIDWFKNHNPFTVKDRRLHSLSTGLAVSELDNINCDEAKHVGSSILNKFDNLSYQDSVLRKADQVKPLSHVTFRRQSSDKAIQIDSTLLFQRLIIIMQRNEEIESYFNYELTPVPTALFKYSTMRKSNKAMLSKKLKDIGKKELSLELPVTYIIDGGWLLHKVKWSQSATYQDVIEQYLEYVRNHFGSNTILVFDGYCNGASIKDHEHDRRSIKAAPFIVYNDKNPVYKNQNDFLCNEANKKSFVESMIYQFKTNGYIVYQAKNDADTLIVDTAIKLAKENSISVVSNDTDVLILLVYHYNGESMKDIIIHHETSKQSVELISVKSIYNSLDNYVRGQLLVIHSLSGCDSTSSLFGLSKITVYNKMIANKDMLSYADILGSINATHKDVESAGLKLLVYIYGGKAKETLNHLRYVRYMDKAASCAQLQPERLPPTERAAMFHLYRVHLQVVLWKTLLNTPIKPEDWGWHLDNGHYEPIMTDLESAPDDILNFVRCKCKIEGRQPCSTQLCSCKRHGLPCVSACKNCNGEECENVNKHLEVFSDSDSSIGDDLEDLVPDDCLQFNIPWIDEEVVEWRVIYFK